MPGAACAYSLHGKLAVSAALCHLASFTEK